MKTELLGLLESGGAPDALRLLDRRMAENPAAAGSCHPLLHELGRSALGKYGSFSEAMRYQTGLCNSGYTHGVIEGSFLAAPDVALAVKSTCPPSVQKHFKEWQCHHGIGHGVMYATEQDVARSLELCGGLAGEFEADACANGVFMERFIVKDHSGTLKSPDMPDISFCANQAQRYRTSCYFYAPTAYLAHNAAAYRQAFKWCLLAVAGYRDTCIAGVGAQAMKENVTTPSLAAALCGQAQARYRHDCVRGAINIYINHHASSEAAEPLCVQSFAAFRDVCLETVSTKRMDFAI